MIRGTGKVGSAVVSASTLEEPGPSKCIANVIKTYEFPELSELTNTIVTAPFTLSARP